MSTWSKIYQAYEEKNCEQLKKLFWQLTEKDKESPYFSEYWSLYVKQCWEKKQKWKISFKWKNIKCPHCGSSITKSIYNNESIKKYIQNWKKWEVELICNYCGTKFLWSPTKFKSLFTDYKIGQEVEINSKKYKISWWVKYRWNYLEDGEYGSLEYIEWLAYDEKWELFYISESLATDDEWEIYKDIEVSQKVNFPFVVKTYNSVSVKTDKWNFLVNEYDEVEVVAVSWEVNKSYKIWEKIKIYAFRDYNLEIERWENNVERNLYKNIYEEDFNDLFSSNWILNSFSYNTSYLKGKEGTYSLFMFYMFIILYSLFILIPTSLFFIIVWIIIYLFIPESIKDRFKNINYVKYIWIALFSVLIFFIIWIWLFYEKVDYKKPLKEVSNIENWNYVYKFSNPINFSNEVIWTYTYGTKYANGSVKWFKFSIQDSSDKEVFGKIKENPNIIKSFNKQWLTASSKLSTLQASKNDLIIKYK